MDVRIEELAPQAVAFIRHTGPYEQCMPAWEALCGWAYPKGFCNQDTRFIGVSYDDPNITPPDKIRYDACITLDNDVEVGGAIGKQTLGGGHYAIFRHKGPYSGLENTYSRLMGQWLPESGREFDDSRPFFELYINNQAYTPPEELLTDIHIPLI